ncbi:hypothetical protein J6590_052893 [Homalodisca vitripennis]|nr:hypothetical protein J6590_052893 [Homalodisca vitripennis]
MRKRRYNVLRKHFENAEVRFVPSWHFVIHRSQFVPVGFVEIALYLAARPRHSLYWKYFTGSFQFTEDTQSAAPDGRKLVPVFPTRLQHLTA